MNKRDAKAATKNTKAGKAQASSKKNKPIDVCMVGTGEYTTGYVYGEAANSDKRTGVVALVMMDLKSRGKCGRLAMAGVNGKKFPGIREHMQRAIGDVYNGLDLKIDTYPKDNKVDADAYKAAIKSFKPGSAVTIFTPDDTHYDIAMCAINQGLHVMVTKPAVMTLEHHAALHKAAKRKGVILCIEVHKRWDPCYADARDKIQNLGPFSYFYAYMSQPKHQLDTFKAWAGKSSDISYYLNSHHVDFHCWSMGNTSRPTSVTALASDGYAQGRLDRKCEDTITVTAQWENLSADGLGVCPQAGTVPGKGTAIYTSSWVAPTSDVHTQQRFNYMGQNGEINVSQAHRGYYMSDDTQGYKSVNPMYMKFTPTDGKFAGQNGYGYRSFENFIDAALAVNAGTAKATDFDSKLATVATTFRATAILEAGRRSLDTGKTIQILYEDKKDKCLPTGMKVKGAKQKK